MKPLFGKFAHHLRAAILDVNSLNESNPFVPRPNNLNKYVKTFLKLLLQLFSISKYFEGAL